MPPVLEGWVSALESRDRFGSTVWVWLEGIPGYSRHYHVSTSFLPTATFKATTTCLLCELQCVRLNFYFEMFFFCCFQQRNCKQLKKEKEWEISYKKKPLVNLGIWCKIKYSMHFFNHLQCTQLLCHNQGEIEVQQPVLSFFKGHKMKLTDGFSPF